MARLRHSTEMGREPPNALTGPALNVLRGLDRQGKVLVEEIQQSQSATLKK
jgi:hypothetical protein